nr:Predicted Co/Zn/Cd cation transporters [Klebsiella pneumoniae]
MTQHNFENDNKYHERSVQARKSTLVSVVVNIFLSALQVVVGIFSGSQGLIADGMHSFSDLVADGVVLMANKRAVDRLTTITTMATGAMRTAPPNHRRDAAARRGGMLWSAAGHLAQPQTIPPVHSAALWMALVALAVKEGLFRYMLAAAGG